MFSGCETKITFSLSFFFGGGGGGGGPQESKINRIQGKQVIHILQQKNTVQY